MTTPTSWSSIIQLRLLRSYNLPLKTRLMLTRLFLRALNYSLKLFFTLKSLLLLVTDWKVTTGRTCPSSNFTIYSPILKISNLSTEREMPSRPSSTWSESSLILSGENAVKWDALPATTLSLALTYRLLKRTRKSFVLNATRKDASLFLWSKWSARMMPPNWIRISTVWCSTRSLLPWASFSLAITYLPATSTRMMKSLRNFAVISTLSSDTMSN